MVAALGVNQKWLFTSVFALGVFLAGLGGALELPRAGGQPHHGPAGDHRGAGRRRDRRSRQRAGHLPRRDHRLRAQRLRHPRLPQDLDRPCLPRHGDCARRAALGTARARRRRPRERRAARSSLAGARSARRGGSSPSSPWPSLRFCRSSRAIIFIGVATEVLIFMLYAASLHFLLAGGGLVSFGHAAYFGLGSYGAAIALKSFGLGMETAIVAGIASRPRRRARFRLVLRAPFRRLFRHADARLRPDRLVDRLPMDRRDGRRQRHHRRLAERLGRFAGALLLADAGAERRRHRAPARDHCSRRSAMRCGRCAIRRCARRRSA